MFRNLIPALADRYRVIAPDYPGFGESAMPERAQFNYSFAKFAEVVDTLLTKLDAERYALYGMDYGAPVGYRLESAALRVIASAARQNGLRAEGSRDLGNDHGMLERAAHREHREKLRAGTTFDATRWQYVDGVQDASRIDPARLDSTTRRSWIALAMSNRARI